MQAENGNKTKTRLFRVSEENFDAILDEAAAIIRRGGTVAFPTETVYGLGADGLNPDAVRKIFEAKERPPGNPLSLLVHSREDLGKIAKNIPEKAFRLMDAFWPGPLTIVLEKNDLVPEITSGNLTSIGLRMPDHRIPLELVKRAGTPLAAPSANLSGKPSPSLASHVLADLTGRIDAVIDGGGAAIGLESTVIDMTVEPPVVLRPGAVGIDELERVIGKVRPAYGESEARAGEAMPEKKAGQKYSHYAPDAQVVLVEGEIRKVSEKIDALLENYLREGKKVGLLLSDETAGFFASERLSAHECFLLGSRKGPEEAARRLFEGLRVLDAKGLDVILADGSFNPSGLGAALLNRLREAASVRHAV
ncbi:tRNA threonylcarbamoyladenosine biosynthesis protein [Methanosarcina sp. 1.H.T.1A.1]|uniref:L-threonylcarbamoyladenylate synthase n=1 Tax=Methanosarcina sp. 1.H.T.1A.1 TaxID=1483602 RepID=UPI000621B987|nr:L-threonylcarbamoyladenylate synthase [Methanosarcina sp. 1.H.T.1A.1]KKH98963.1 tRNA threonylcarbamoyladenosine biosynthesis protein [Methanosarcina sp. 1.H.T.1A.1]